MRIALSRTIALAAASTLIATTAACGSSQETLADDAAGVSITDGWVKAADSGMTAAFGTISNASDHEVTITSVSSPASPEVQLHEMKAGDSGNMVMTEKPNGLSIPAKGKATLEAGGDHIMLMDLADPLKPGENVALTLTFSDDSTMKLEVPARSFAGADEEYDPSSSSTDEYSDESGDHSEHDHSDHEH